MAPRARALAPACHGAEWARAAQFCHHCIHNCNSGTYVTLILVRSPSIEPQELKNQAENCGSAGW
jgi:hypothetical protein